MKPDRGLYGLSAHVSVKGKKAKEHWRASAAALVSFTDNILNDIASKSKTFIIVFITKNDANANERGSPTTSTAPRGEKGTKPLFIPHNNNNPENNENDLFLIRLKISLSI